MAQYDGSIRINTQINTQNASAQLMNLANRIEKTADKIASLRSKMNTLKDTATPTKEFLELSDYIQRSEMEFDRLLSQQRQMQAEGKNSGSEWENLNSQMEIIGENIHNAEKYMQSLVDSGKAFNFGANSEEFAQMSTQMQQLNQQMQSDVQRQSELQTQIAEREEHIAGLRENAVVGNQRIVETVERIKELEQEIADLKSVGVTEGYKDYDSKIQELRELRQEIKDYNNSLDEIRASYKSVGSIARETFATMAKGIQTALTQGVTDGYERLHSSLVDFAGTATRVSDSVKNAFTGIRNAFSTLKENPQAVIHEIANGLLNMASTINSTVYSALNALGYKLGYVWGSIKDTTFKTVDSIKEKMAGFAGIVINSVLHPVKTLKNVATPIINGLGEVFKNVIEGIKSRAAGFAAGVLNGILHPLQTIQNAYEKLGEAAKKFGSVAKSVFSSLGNLTKKLDSGLKKIVNTMSGFFNASKKNAENNNNLLKTGLKFILKYGLGIRSLYILVNKIRTGIKEGFSNFMEYSSEFKSSIDSIKASALTLKNAFAAAFSPLVEIAIPYIQRVIDYLVKLMDVIGQVMAAITGQETYTRAIKQTTAAIEDQNKAQNKQLSGLDKLNNLTSSSGGGEAGGGAADMFEEAPIEDKWQKMADKIKEIGKSLFAPLKAAWDKEGKFVMDSWKYALDEIKKLVKDIGRDFLTVWNQPETIAMFEDIFHIVGDIGLVVGNLAKNFREAWNTNQVGLHIFENIRDILAVIIHNIRLAADYTVEWSKTLDFYPLLSKIEEWTRSLVPVFDALSGILMDFYTMVLLPLAKWTLERGLPELLQVFIDFNEKVDWVVLRANLAEFWQHLEPFAETIGEGLIIFIGRLSDALANFINSDTFVRFLSTIEEWMDNVKPEDVANALEKLAIALISIKVAVMGFSAISAAIPVFKSLASVLGLFGPAGIAVGALALAAFLSKTIEDVDMGRVGQAVGNAVIKLVDFIGQALSQTNWYMLGQKVVDFIAGIDWMGLFTSLVEALAGILGNVIGGAFALVAALSEGIADLIINAVDAAKEYFQGKIEECGGNIVLGILKGIIDGIAGIGNWIYEHILEPFITGFKNAFGIHSPSTVMMEMGTYIIQGLLDGITSLVDKVTETWESMKETALEIWENVKTGLSEKWENTKEKASEIWGNVKDNFAETWNLIEESASKKWSDIKENLSGKWEDMKTNASTIFTDLKTSLSGIWNEISTTVSDKWNEIKTTISGVVDDVKGKIDGFISNIKDAIQSVKDFFSSGIDKIGSAISGAFSGGGGSVAAFSGVSTYSAMPQIAALSKMEFPGYATGQVIPTSMKKHLAWLGDNNHETEVVSPLSTIEEAVERAMLRVNGNSEGKVTIEIPIYLDKREIGRGMQEYDREVFMKRGRGAFEH